MLNIGVLMEDFSQSKIRRWSARLTFIAFMSLYMCPVAAQSYGSFSDWLTRKDRISDTLLKKLSVPGSEPFMKEYLGFGSEFCKEAEEGDVLKASPAAMIRQAQAEERSEDFCDAAQIYMEMRKFYPYEPFWTDSGIRAVMAYIQAGDYLAAINEANDIYDVSQNTPYQETIHLLMITTVYKKMQEHGVENSHEWTRYLLGIDGTQTDGNVYLNRLSFRSFEKNFPESSSLPLLESWKRDARNRYADSFMLTALRHKKNDDQLAAILSLMNILRIGPVVTVFPEATFEAIDSYIKFSRMIRDSRSVSDDQLREWLKIDESEKLDRKTAAAETLEQARKIYELMKQNLPDNTWTLKAGRLIYK